MNYHKIILITLFIFSTITVNAQDVSISGGGVLMDWANLKLYEQKNEELKKINNSERIVFMGNSITQGWIHLRKDFFIDNNFVNRGIGGQTTPQMLIRFKPDVVNLNPRAVVILAGINDIAQNTGPISIKNIAENIISMVEIANAYNIKVFICSTLPAIDFPWSPGLNPGPKVIELNSILKTYCYKNNITYVDYFKLMADKNGGLKVPDYTSADDLVHPNINGYKVMERLVLESIKNELKR